MSSAAPPRLRTGFVLSATPKRQYQVRWPGPEYRPSRKVDSRMADGPFVDTARSVRVSANQGSASFLACQQAVGLLLWGGKIVLLEQIPGFSQHVVEPLAAQLGKTSTRAATKKRREIGLHPVMPSSDLAGLAVPL